MRAVLQASCEYTLPFSGGSISESELHAREPFVDANHFAPLGPSPYSTRVQATEIKVDEFVEAYEILIIPFGCFACRSHGWVCIQPS